MTSAIIPALAKVGTGLLYDLAKSFHKDIDRNINNEVEEFLVEFIDTDLDSGSFARFLQRTETKQVFKSYIRFYSIVQNQNDWNYDGILTRSEFINKLSNQAINFVYEDIGISLSEDRVDCYFKALLSIIEAKLLTNLKTESTSLMYFFKQSLIESEKRILDSISKPLLQERDDFEQTRISYQDILTKKYSKDVVYGVDQLDFYSFYVFPTLQIEDTSKEAHDMDWRNIFVESNVVSIIGGAGFGKSLFLKNLMNKYSELNVFEAEELLPIYCDLKQFVKFSHQTPSYSLEDFLVDTMIKNTLMDSTKINKDFLNYFIKSGRCLILFDALDEITDIDERNDLNDKIVNYFTIMNRNNKVCVTSRELGFIPKTHVTLKVRPLEEEDIEQYLDNMSKLGFFNPDDTASFLSQCEEMIDNNFLDSFLILSLLVNIFRAERELPANKVELYNKCIEYISRKREIQKKTDYDFTLISSILDNDATFEALANLSKPNNIEVNHFQVQNCLVNLFERTYGTQYQAFVAVKEFLKFCIHRTELYVGGPQEDTYKFYHRSFFEYFYARFLINEFIENDVFLKELFRDFNTDSEIFEITIQLLKNTSYKRFNTILEIVIEMLNDLNDPNDKSQLDTFEKISLLLMSTDEKYYLQLFYNFLFNEKQYLIHFANRNWQVADLILLKVKDKKSIVEDLLKYYPEETLEQYIPYKIWKENRDQLKLGGLRVISMSLFHILMDCEKELLSSSKFKNMMNEIDTNSASTILTKMITRKEESPKDPETIEVLVQTFKNFLTTF
ncbi:hypothetical protein bcere0007_54070 [Bacillus mycoides]|uniref:NACHT domain-containing protein n=1 Tax=Bacillus mycoides TaxID=1405 RepID=UPI0001A0309D|nr:NACHT domain-containing protein [Bacillus mycoides]EEK70134.1 hypothetical protein bcere0007_54070 [Bacillus mycoides]